MCILEINRLSWCELESLSCSRLAGARLVSCHREVAGRCHLGRSLLESRGAAVIKGVEGEVFDHRAGVVDGKGTGAGGEANREIGIGVWHDSAETLAVDAGLTDAEVRVGNIVVGTDRVGSCQFRALKVIVLDAVLADGARVTSWDLKRLTLALNGVLTALMGARKAARLSKEVKCLISIYVDERFR